MAGMVQAGKWQERALRARQSFSLTERRPGSLLATISLFICAEAKLYSLFRTNGLRHVMERELVPFAVALLMAQLWFKWGSFALELVGFVAVWLLFGFFADVLLSAKKR